MADRFLNLEDFPEEWTMPFTPWCGDKFWEAAAVKISLRLKAGQLTQAVEEAVHDVGEVLAQHFPCSRSETNS